MGVRDEAVRQQAGAVPAVIALSTISVRDVSVEADIGVLPHELGVPQTLLLSATLRVRPVTTDRLEDGVDYRLIVTEAERLAATRIGLVETFAQRLATFCLALPGVEEADVAVEKPAALARGMAGARVVLRRAGGPAPLRAV